MFQRKIWTACSHLYCRSTSLHFELLISDLHRDNHCATGCSAHNCRCLSAGAGPDRMAVTSSGSSNALNGQNGNVHNEVAALQPGIRTRPRKNALAQQSISNTRQRSHKGKGVNKQLRPGKWRKSHFAQVWLGGIGPITDVATNRKGLFLSCPECPSTSKPSKDFNFCSSTRIIST